MVFNSQIKPKHSGVGESVNHAGVNDNTANQGKMGGGCMPFHNVAYFHAALDTTVSSSILNESSSFIWRLSKP